MNIINATDADLKYFEVHSSLTFTGCAATDENIEFLLKWFEEHNCKMTSEDMYVITGKQMNTKYRLKGNNRYPDELHFLVIKLEDLSNVGAIIMPRFEIGGRWFDDIVANNRRHNK